MDIAISNIAQGSGWSVALTGMLIVFTALALMSGFIAVLPRALGLLDRWFPSEPTREATVTIAPRPPAEITPEALAAIAMAVHADARRRSEKR